ncbi:hypothetical protein ACQEU6_06055 [Spirillospora sp. CA-108201]
MRAAAALPGPVRARIWVRGRPVRWFSVLWALIDLVWYTAVVWLVGAAQRVLGRPGVRRRLDQVSGVVLVGLGVRLAAEAR